MGYYNSIAAYTIGQIWNTDTPSLSNTQFNEGASVVKILLTDAKPEDFNDTDILQNSPMVPGYVINRSTGVKSVQQLRLLQIDFAIRDKRALETGWVFGTFAYDYESEAKNSWERMKFVGLMWGNDPSLTYDKSNAGASPIQSLINSRAPQYSIKHLGWGGRLNGPVDNPASSCLSCHSTAQAPNNAPLAWDNNMKCSNRSLA